MAYIKGGRKGRNSQDTSDYGCNRRSGCWGWERRISSAVWEKLCRRAGTVYPRTGRGYASLFRQAAGCNQGDGWYRGNSRKGQGRGRGKERGCKSQGRSGEEQEREGAGKSREKEERGGAGKSRGRRSPYGEDSAAHAKLDASPHAGFRVSARAYAGARAARARAYAGARTVSARAYAGTRAASFGSYADARAYAGARTASPRAHTRSCAG